MQPQRLTGSDAGVLKYDLLTALSVAGLSGSPTLQTSCLRLVALVTARYNWRDDEVTVGQRDMARMWSVNERTVKREIKRLTGAGILLCKRPGVRGRVAAYRLGQSTIATLSRPCWPLVGPDFDARMQARFPVTEMKIVQLSAYTEPATAPRAAPWETAMTALSRAHPDLYKAWFAQLSFVSFARGILRIRARSKFVQRYVETHHMPLFHSVMSAEFGAIDRIAFVDEGGA